jgi:MBOAT, membrane-bound O-acyltransferase family
LPVTGGESKVSDNRRRSIPGFHSFIVRTVGDPRRLPRFCWNWFARPLRAGSFAGFWRRWNPVYGYLLLFYVYRPLRRVAPRPIATVVTFLVSGFVLHDVPFGNGVAVLRGQGAVPEVTILMGIFGVMTVATEALGIDALRYGPMARAAINVGLVVTGFVLRRLVVVALAA